MSSLRAAAVDLLQALTKNFKPAQYYNEVVLAVGKDTEAGTASISSQVLALSLACDGLNHLFRGEDGCV